MGVYYTDSGPYIKQFFGAGSGLLNARFVGAQVRIQEPSSRFASNNPETCSGSSIGVPLKGSRGSFKRIYRGSSKGI